MSLTEKSVVILSIGFCLRGIVVCEDCLCIRKLQITGRQDIDVAVCFGHGPSYTAARPERFTQDMIHFQLSQTHCGSLQQLILNSRHMYTVLLCKVQFKEQKNDT